MLGEFLPFLLLHTPKLKSLGQWLNTMIYGLEILKDLPEYASYVNTSLQEFSYSSDRSLLLLLFKIPWLPLIPLVLFAVTDFIPRNYFCQPYIGFVPESQEFKNVRKEMVRYSSR